VGCFPPAGDFSSVGGFSPVRDFPPVGLCSLRARCTVGLFPLDDFFRGADEMVTIFGIEGWSKTSPWISLPSGCCLERRKSTPFDFRCFSWLLMSERKIGKITFFPTSKRC
jgi:hypothetical protein